ncbi:OmpA family protein [Croceibacterium sp. LX-88]|uniref:OmpA family protein n=1 Tax=Croceibacterium selenioxidans TaxID=2838833 RepID=A0ABS5W2V2_9SPHN|nr:OmpA family protein [Croceibacterium selenioxidans]MBT2134081.1 OmpA family protein [Croceibacterium selenioxidans]
MGRRFALAASLALLASTPALAQDDKLEGVIVRSGDGQVVLQTGNTQQTVTLDSDTRIRSTAGALNVRKEDKAASDLLPGLPIKVQGTNNGGSFAADEIEFKQSDYRTAVQIRAGQAETREALAQTGEFDVRAEANVYFASGSSTINAEGKRSLNDLATQAQSIEGYAISVLGYADPTGDAAANQRLSSRRAQNVIDYLKQRPGIQPGRVIAASAMGEVDTGASATPTSNAEARRVTARVVTSKARLANP